jgi:protein gp37
MADHTPIEWTDATWNPITGCTLVSAGCTNCYAARLAATRLRNHPSRAGLARLNAAGVAKFTGEVRFNEQWLDQPLRWQRPRRVFVCAHGDLFHEDVPDAWIDRVFAVMALAPQHTFQVLTKRPERMREMLRAVKRPGLPERALEHINALARNDAEAIAATRRPTLQLPNVWLGVSVEDQATADTRIPHLLATPAAVRFVSAEPLLGPLDLRPYLYIVTHEDAARIEAAPDDRPPTLDWHDPATTPPEDIQSPRLDWVIAGGESGPGARPMHPDWARGLREQCAEAGVALHFKQWGEWAPRRSARQADLVNANKSLIVRPDGGVTSGLMEYGRDAWLMDKVGKTAAGRLLDGIEHNAMPEGVSW